MRYSLCLFSVACVLGSGYAALYTDPAQLPSGRQYDYIIVGAGPGGSVLARRLAENSTTNVLIIEAGGLPDDNLNITVPYFSTNLFPDKPWDWNYVTTAQSGLNNRSIDYPRGKVLGGTTCVNDMVWTRGSRDDFDRYANVSGDSGWSWDSILPYLMGVEQLVPAADGRNTTGEIEPSLIGKTGLLGISPQSVPTQLDPLVINSTAELSAEFPFNPDMNSGNTLGVGWAQYTLRNGSRQDAANTYLEPVVNTTNLDVLINTQVTKVVQTGVQDGVPVINGVEFSQNATSTVHSLNASKEVILAAGAVNSPQILLLSGLGPSANLTALNITTIVDLPYVGSNLQDHALLLNTWEVNANFTWDDINRNTTLFEQEYALWNTSRNGTFTAGTTTQVAWLRLADNDTIFENFTDPAAGLTSGHYEFVFSPMYYGVTPSTGHFMTIITNLASPASRGSLSLNTSSPWDFPLIDPGLLSSDFDIHIMVEAQKAARRFLSSPTFSSYVIESVIPPANATTDDDFAKFARNNAGTVFHPTGTTAMSAWNDTTSGVVNPDMTVKGTKGLRVCDAGVLPFVPAAHPQAAVYAFAERTADLIKAAASSQ